MRRLLPVFLLLSACASKQPEQLPAPQWDDVPAGITAALCERLQMDGIGSIGTDIALVRVTQPIATPQVLALLGKQKRQVTVVQRAIPVQAVAGGTGGCAWKLIDAVDPARQRDAMVVELSAPVANPAARYAAGIVARASLGGTHPTWYWIELVPGSSGWFVGRILPLAM